MLRTRHGEFTAVVLSLTPTFRCLEIRYQYGPKAERRLLGISNEKAAIQLFASDLLAYAGDGARRRWDQAFSEVEQDIIATCADHASENLNSLAVLYRAGSLNAPVQRVKHEILDALGWNAFSADQITPDDAGLEPARISRVHRSRRTALSAAWVRGAKLFQVAT